MENREVSGFHQNTQSCDQHGQKKPLDKGFAGQQSKVTGMFVGVSPEDRRAASAKQSSLHLQGASIPGRGKLALCTSEFLRLPSKQCKKVILGKEKKKQPTDS